MNKARREKLAEECAARKMSKQEALEEAVAALLPEKPFEQVRDIAKDIRNATPPKPKREHGRLPDKSVYLALYDGVGTRWDGDLIISCPQDVIDAILAALATIKGRAAIYEASHSALFKLLGKLDNQHRETMAK